MVHARSHYDWRAFACDEQKLHQSSAREGRRSHIYCYCKFTVHRWHIPSSQLRHLTAFCRWTDRSHPCVGRSGIGQTHGVSKFLPDSKHPEGESRSSLCARSVWLICSRLSMLLYSSMWLVYASPNCLFLLPLHTSRQTPKITASYG